MAKTAHMHMSREAAPTVDPKKRLQVAALCYKETEGGKKVLLITSRGTGRWIVPKGWPIDGKDGAASALQEAWEEAGVSKADIQQEPIGLFDYVKKVCDGEDIPVMAQVYLTQVKDLKKNYPEVDERRRAWFAPDEAAALVDEPELKVLLQSFERTIGAT